MEQKATKTAYLPEFGRTFEVPADWDGTKINYFARQKMNNLSVEETIGMQPVAPKTKYLNYTPLASNENVLYDLNLKKQGEETGFLTTTGKSAWNGLIDLTLGVASEGANVIAQNVTERHLNKTQASKERKEEVTKRLLDVQKQSREWVDEYKFDINPYESKLAQGLGSIGVTYASLGAGVLAKTLKGKTIAEAVREGMPLIALFGLSSGGNMFYDVRQEGGSLLEANTRALGAGLLEAGIERLGLEGIVRGLRSKYVGSYILAPALTGSAQETSQSAKDILIKGKYDKRSEEEKLNELIDSALLGSIGGAIEFGVARVVAGKDIKKIEKTLEKGGVDKKTARNVAYTQMLPKEEAIKVREEIRLQGVKAGYDEETSQNIAEAVTQSPEQVLNDVIDIMNREEPYEISEELREELKNTYIEATSVANEDADKYILMKDEIKSLIEKAGKDEQEADETARMMTSIAINSYQIAKEQGVDIDFDKIKNEVFKLNNIINYAQNEPISKAEQEDIWREVERERVAELQEGVDRYMEESQRGVLFSKTITNNKGEKRVYVNPQKSELSQILDNKGQRVLINKETGKYYSIDADNNIHFDIIDTLLDNNKDGLTQDDVKDYNSRLRTYYNKYEAIYLTKRSDVTYEGHPLIYTSDGNFSHYKLPHYETLEEARDIYNDYKKNESIGKLLGEFDELSTVRYLKRKAEEEIGVWSNSQLPSASDRVNKAKKQLKKLEKQENELLAKEEDFDKIDRERLEFERKDINPELKGREDEKVKAVKINRFFTDKKSSKDISIDDVITAINTKVKVNEKGMRVLKNSVTGETATLSKNALNKMYRTTSMPSDDNIGGILGKESIANIADIFNSALLVKTHDDEKHGSKNKIHRYANVIQSSKDNVSPIETFIVKITVKELSGGRRDLTDIEIEDNKGKNLTTYDLKVGKKNTAGNSLGNFATGINRTVAHNSSNDFTINDLIDFVNTYTEKTIKINGVNRPTQNSAGNRIARTEEGLRLFYKWFGDSKVVDKDGRPLVVYHGTNASFDIFKGTKVLNSSEGVGFNFTSDENVAKGFGKPMPVYLKLKNPVYAYSNIDLIGDNYEYDYEAENQEAIRDAVYQVKEKLEQKGYTFYNEVESDMLDVYSSKKQAQEVLDGLLDLGIYIEEDYDAETLYNDIRQAEIEVFGIDGYITNNYANSGNPVYIAFKPEQIKSVYNRGSFDENNKNIYYSQTEGDILGSYNMAKREVKLFKGHNPSTLTHELGHHFIISHLNFMESIGANDKNKPVFEFLSGLANREINSVRDMERADHENLVEAFIDYMNLGQAPNIVTGNIFQRAKNWLINEYNIHKTTASKEIREYFDGLISREGAIPDVSKIQDRIGEFKEILRQAQKGEQVSFNGMGIKEVKDLKKAINTKIRRKGLSLRDELIKAGGIKEGTELAKSLGFDVLKKDKMFTRKATAFEKEDELIEWLAEKGYITPVQEGESYSDTEARWSEVENLIYDAEIVYRPEEQRLNEEREASLVNQAKAQEIVDDILKDNKLGLKGVNDLYDLLQKISSRKDDVDIIKINKGAIKYLETRLNDLQRDYNDIIKQKDIEARKIGKELIKANEDIRNLKEEKEVSKIEKNVAQEQYLEFVRNQHLSGDYKVKFLSKVDEINSFNDLVRVVRRVTPQIQRVIEMEMKHIQKRNIDIVLKRSKPKKRTQQISTYTYNKFFEELRAINKMTKDEAKVGISNLMKEMEKRDENMEGFAFEWKDIIKNKFLHYKSLGMDASLDLMTSLHNDLIELYGEAVQKGIDAKIEKSDKRLAEINKVNDYVENNQVARNFISNLFNPNGKSDDVYIKNTNFYGISNALFGKKWADEHEMVTVLNQVQNDVYKRHDQMIRKTKEIYKVGKRNKLQDVMAEKNSKDFILTANDGLSYELSIMDIMDLYLGLKNEKTKRQLLKNYEEFDEEGEQTTSQIDDLIGNLSVEDKEFADWLQKDLEKNYDELNKLYIKMYGIDMKQEENYFPRKSERRDIILDLENINSYSPIQAISGMMKDRASSVKPLAVNVLQKYEENIAEYYYMIDAFEKFKDIYDVVTSKNVRASVNKKYSQATYTALINSLKSMSLRGMQVHTSDIDGVLNKIVSNVIGSKIAVNVDVFLKQLISVTNYSEKMPVKEFTHNFIEAITHPKETIEFMNNFDKDFFEARKNMGLQSEAVSRMKRELENMKHNNFFEEKFNIKGLKISAGAKYQWSQAMGFMVKYGDIGAIYFGGYARVKNLLDSGMSVEEARKQFRLETLQSQQDSSPANLAQYQFSRNGFARLFSAFLNAPAQYMRKMYDADIQYRRKEITAEQFKKTIINYGVIQPALFVLVGNMLRDLWDGDDESSWFDGMASQILTSPLQGIPFLGNMVTQVASYIEKKITTDKGNTYNLVSVLLADDLNRAFNKIGKEDKGALDWIDILTPLFETVAVTPVTMARKVVKAVETRID